MKFEGWQKVEGYERFPIHYWVKYRPDEPIPDELKFEGWQEIEEDVKEESSSCTSESSCSEFSSCGDHVKTKD